MLRYFVSALLSGHEGGVPVLPFEGRPIEVLTPSLQLVLHGRTGHISVLGGSLELVPRDHALEPLLRRIWVVHVYRKQFARLTPAGNQLATHLGWLALQMLLDLLLVLGEHNHAS